MRRVKVSGKRTKSVTGVHNAIRNLNNTFNKAWHYTKCRRMVIS